MVGAFLGVKTPHPGTLHDRFEGVGVPGLGIPGSNGREFLNRLDTVKYIKLVIIPKGVISSFIIPPRSLLQIFVQI